MEPKQPQDTESRHADKYIVRFPDGMRNRLKELAKSNNRTLNAEIVARLEGSFAAPHGLNELTSEAQLELFAVVQRQQRIQISTLEFQLAMIEEQLSLLHNPLSEVLEALNQATTEGNKEAATRFHKEADRIKMQISSFDLRRQGLLDQLSILKQEIKSPPPPNPPSDGA